MVNPGIHGLTINIITDLDDIILFCLFQEWKEYKLQKDTELRFEVEHNETVVVKVTNIIISSIIKCIVTGKLCELLNNFL